MTDDLHERAAAGDPNACMHLAKRLMRGRGEPRNYEKAVQLFDVAARAGDADAMYQLGKCYLKGIGCPRDPSGGVSCFEQAAKLGHSGATLRLGECFEKGNGAPKSPELAAWWYRKAAALGVPKAYDALLRLARHRISVLFAMLRDGTYYEPRTPSTT